MNPDGQMDFQVSIISNVEDRLPKPIGFRDALSGIRTGRWAKLVEACQRAYQEGYKLPATPKKKRSGEMEAEAEARVRQAKDAAAPHKKAMPAILFSGTFSEREAAKLTKHSGLIAADLDQLDDRVGSIKEQICADPHVIAAFVSPTGTGLKVVFRCDPDRPHLESYEALEHYVLENFGLLIDQKCKDVSRMCFISHDPELFASDNADALPYPPKAEKTKTDFILPPRSASPDLKPGEDFNQRGAHEIPKLLESHGWTKFRGDKYWTRPGKTTGVSASWGHFPNTLVVFSESGETGFPAERDGFDPFAIFTHLEHNGDWQAATKALAERGYGTPAKKKTSEARETPAYNENIPVGQGADDERKNGTNPSTSPWPEPVSASSLCDKPPETPPVLIDGILYRGGTMLLSGPSKSHKTYTMMDVAVAISDGEPWLGFKTTKSAVLYLNLELQAFAAAKRLAQICSALGRTPPQNLHMWNLRGHEVTLDKLARVLPQKIKDLGIGCVMIDPHYKISSVSGMEENSNDDQGKLLSALEGLCGQNGAAFAACHHFAKGDASQKSAIDRASGGGVFARWGDVMLTLTPHEEDDAMTIEMALRNFAPVEPFVVRWKHPRWSRDDDLDPAKLKQKPGGAKERFSADELLKKLSVEGMTFTEWMKASGLTESTFKRKRDLLLDEDKITCQMGVYKPI